MKRFQLVIGVSIYFLIYTAISALPNCPPETGVGCSPWVTGYYSNSTTHPQCIVNVTYKWRVCNGEYQVYYESVEKTGNCTNMSELWDDQNYISSFSEWLDIVIIEDLYKLSGQPTIPTCPDNSTKAKFYTASCGVWVKCTYEVQTVTRTCDPDWRGAFPDYADQGKRKVDYWKWQPCGEACCKKTYTVCSQDVGTSGTKQVIIQSVSKERIGVCSNPDNFIKPCLDGC